MRASNFNNSEFIDLKNKDWLNKQRVAGKITAGALCLLEQLVKDKQSLSLKEYNSIAHEYIINHNCAPTFLGYKGFPASVCISVDNIKSNQLVHGIPTDYKPSDGDIIKFDLGATYEGAISDSALTCIFGTPKSEQHIDLIKSTQNALYAGIKSIKVGNRLGCIGDAIYKNRKQYSVITNYGGHGLSWNIPHSQPFVANRSNINEGIRIQNGLSIAIEPMFCLEDDKTWIGEDRWTIFCSSVSSHFEHSIFVHNDGVEVISLRESEEIS